MLQSAVPQKSVITDRRDFSRRYRGDRACLAAYLALKVAEVLGGVKPSNLVKLDKRPRPCGRNLYDLWKRHGRRLMAGSGLQAKELLDRGDSLLLLFYEEEALAGILGRKGAAVILRRAGYAAPGDLDGVLRELAQRFAGPGFPHEIGVFLGYPLKDVVGFLGWARLPFTCQGPWRIYGAAEESLRLADIHREERCRIACALEAGEDPLCCFRFRKQEPVTDLRAYTRFVVTLP